MNVFSGMGAEANTAIAVDITAAPGSVSPNSPSLVGTDWAAGSGNWKNLLASLGVFPAGSPAQLVEPAAVKEPSGAGPNTPNDHEIAPLPSSATALPNQAPAVKQAKHIRVAGAISGHQSKSASAADAPPPEKHAEAMISDSSAPQAAPVVPLVAETPRLNVSPRMEVRSSGDTAAPEIITPSITKSPQPPSLPAATPTETSSVPDASPQLRGNPTDDRSAGDRAPVIDTPPFAVRPQAETKPAEHMAAPPLAPIADAPVSTGAQNAVQINNNPQTRVAAARAVDRENPADPPETGASLPAPINLDLPRVPSRSNITGDRRITEPVLHRAAKTSPLGTAQPKNAAMILGDSGSIPVNALPLRDPDRMASPGERHPGAAHPVPASGDPFRLLDDPHSAPTPSWIHAGTHHAEAGYLDPVLGWVRVRADSLASGMHAALVPSSPEAAQVLGSHLAGLNAYLSEHHTEPPTVTVDAQGARGEMGHSPGDQSSGRRQNGEGDKPRDDHERLSGITERGAGPPQPTAIARQAYEPGKHISVMA
jgi:hypothetical protein